MHHTLKPPIIQTADGLTSPTFGTRFLDLPTAPPAADWASPDFDDSGWARAVALRACKTPYLARLCLRGKFEVTDPAKVADLRLTVGYYGGAIVQVNGQEVARADLPTGVAGDNALADPYSVEAYVLPDGSLMNRRNASGPEAERRLALRDRLLADVTIPTKLLRKGVNVVAIELVRAPYDKIQNEKKVTDDYGQAQYALMWNTCELRRVQLSAAGADGLVPNAVRPAGLQAWNSDMAMSDFDLDFGDRTEPLRPVKIAAARNGTFSGKVVVGSDQSLKGLKATVGDLANGEAKIPSTAVRIRYGRPWGDEEIFLPPEQLGPYPRAVNVFGMLDEAAPSEIPVYAKSSSGGKWAVNLPNQPNPVFGAVAPVWFTVSVPADAAPGTYRGLGRIAVDGQTPVTVPLEVQVEDWRLPDTQDYKTWVDLIEIPDTLILEYGMAPWSAQHWKMVDQAFKYIGEAASRTVYIPLIAETNLGHAESMVRWIKRADGSYDHDFTVFDRYLDSAVGNMGQPKIIILWVWEIYLTEEEKYSGTDSKYLAEALAARAAMRGTGPRVTVLDPATGKTETVALPPYKDPAAKALWQPLLAKVQERLKARGLSETVMFGMCNDVCPSKETVKFFDDLRPGTPWASQAHIGFTPKGLVGDIAKCGYQVREHVTLSKDQSLHGWTLPYLLTLYERDHDLNSKTPAVWSHMTEMCITSELRGIGRLGADNWPCIKDNKGARKGHPWARYVQSSWRNLDLYSAVLAPGPDGPLATPQFERMREGLEHCEARIFLEGALLDPALRDRLGADLADRVQQVLDERQTAMVRSTAHLQMNEPAGTYVNQWRQGHELTGQMWWAGSGWQERSRQLFATAAEVARRLGTR
jgi:hypothetical protein